MDKLLFSDALAITYADTHTQACLHTLTPTPFKRARGAVSISCGGAPAVMRQVMHI